MPYPEPETIIRYLKSYVKTSDLTYLGPAGETPDLLDRVDKEPQLWFPVIVPSEPIQSVHDLIAKDFAWWVFRGENVPGFQGGQMLLSIDFDLARGKRALTFAFLYQEERWLRFLVKANRVAILESPSASMLTALTLDFGNKRLIPVEEWLASCSVERKKKWWHFWSKTSTSNPRTELNTDHISHKGQEYVQETDSKMQDNLERWIHDGAPMRFINGKQGKWTDKDWEMLVHELKETKYWPLDPDKVGEVLEKTTIEWERKR